MDFTDKLKRSGSIWVRITDNVSGAAKPHWSPDGRAIYFVSTRGTGLYNVWGIRFDPGQGKPVGEPFRVTSFESPVRRIWSALEHMEIALSRDRLVVPIEEATGSIWVLDEVDR